MVLQFKEKFVERYSRLTDFSKFKERCEAYLERAIRVNTLKGSVEGVRKSIEAKGWKLRKIPWCAEGFWIRGPVEGVLGSAHLPKNTLISVPAIHSPPPTQVFHYPNLRHLPQTELRESELRERRDVGNLLEHHLGKIYVQEAASLIPPLVLKPKAGELVLDMCAAPGSKTTQMAAMMKNKGLLIANDMAGERLQALGINLQRCGATNTVITLGSGYRFKGFKFDKILVDAPCSATGTIMRSFKTVEMWNPGMVKHLSRVQRRLLETGFQNLKRKGVLVYSTCTMEPEEDEGVVSWLLEKYTSAKLEEIKEKELPGLKRSPAVMEFKGENFDSEVKKCLRIWPQDNKTEGFFVAKLRKK